MTDHSEEAVVERCAMNVERQSEHYWGEPQLQRQFSVPEYRGNADQRRKETFDCLSALTPGDRLPGGNVVMPVEPDDGMIEAGEEEIAQRRSVGCGIYAADIYAAMLAAAGEANEPD